MPAILSSKQNRELISRRQHLMAMAKEIKEELSTVKADIIAIAKERDGAYDVDMGDDTVAHITFKMVDVNVKAKDAYSYEKPDLRVRVAPRV